VQRDQISTQAVIYIMRSIRHGFLATLLLVLLSNPLYSAEPANLNFSTSSTTISNENFTSSVTGFPTQVTSSALNLNNININTQLNFIPSISQSVTTSNSTNILPSPLIVPIDKNSINARLLKGEIIVDGDQIVINSPISQSDFSAAINKGGIHHSTRVTLNPDGSFSLRPQQQKP